MKTGSPGFVGSRLREARETRLMTAATLSELTGATTSAISSYENGHSTPSPAVLDQICAILNYKSAFFFRPEEHSSQQSFLATFERSRASSTKKARTRARHRRAWLREILRYLEQMVKLPEHNVPSASDQSHWFGISDQEIERLAQTTRRYWKLGDGPISNMTLLVENQGVMVSLMEMGTPKLDAFSVWDHTDKRPYLVLGKDGQSAFRTRFSVAHELGHLILHKNVTHVEFNSREYFNAIEAQADRFASAFLTPSTTFPAELYKPSLDGFRALKAKWRVSIKMMIHRAQELDIIGPEEARRLYIGYSRRGWQISEPFDDSTEVEEPRLFRRAFEAIIDNDVIERAQIAAALPFNRGDIELLANLPRGYLDEESPYNWAIRELNSGFPKE